MTRWMAWAVGCALALNGCASDDLGDVSVTVQALSASDVARVTVTVEGAGIAPPIVQDLVPVGAQWQGELGGIPAGTDRTFTVVAYDAMGVEVYRGVETGVEVQRNRTVTVAILLQQSTPPDRRRNDPPRIEVVQVIPGVLAPGETASVLVAATDPDPGDVLTYEWTATDGAFAEPTLPATTWTAPMADGTYRLTITVRDAAGARRAVRVDVPVGAAFGRGSARIGVSMNTWPEIERFAIDPGLVGAGETADLLITVSDADGDAVSTTFTNDCGATIVGATFTAPASVPPEGITCSVELRAADGRGGESFADATVFVGTEIAGNHGPVIDHSFQSRWVAGPGTVVDLDVSALDADGDILTFTWTATSGTLGPQTDTATTSALQWTSTGARATIVARATDPSGAYTEAVFEVTAGWLIGAGSAGQDEVSAVATNGTRIVVGGLAGGPMNVRGTSIGVAGEPFILVLDADGSPVWWRSFSGGLRIAAVGIDGSGNVFVVGIFAGLLDLGGASVPTHGGDDLFVASYTSAGALRWGRALGTPAREESGRLAIDAARGRLIVGGTQGPGAMDLGGGVRTHSSPYSGFVTALDAATGDWIWDAMMAGSGSGGSHVLGLAVDPGSGEVLASGLVYGGGTVYLCGARSAASTGSDGLLFRLASDGTCRWGTQYSNAGHGGTGYVLLTAVGVDPTGGSYAMVHYERGLRRQPYGGGFSIASLGGYDVAVLSHAADGTERWTAPTTVAITSQGDDAQLATASDGTIWIAGHYRDAEVAYVERIVDGGTSGTRAGHVNANPPGQDVVRGVAAFHADQPVVVGFYSSAGFSAEGDTLGYSGGPSDGFIWRHQATIP